MIHLVARGKSNHNIFLLMDESLEGVENLPEPSVLVAENVVRLEVALEVFRSVEEVLADTK